MALDDILSAIRRDARAEARALRREGTERARAIEAEAKRRADEVAASIAERAERDAAEARRDLTSRAERDRRALRLATERERLSELFGELEAALTRSREDPDHHRAMTIHLVAEALAALPDATVVRLDPRDRAIIEPLLDTETLEVDPSLTTWGGVVTCTDAGRRRMDNTLEARLMARREDLLLLIASAQMAEGNEP